MKKILFLCLLACNTVAYAQTDVQLDEVVVTGTEVKQAIPLNEQPVSYSKIGETEMENNAVTSVKTAAMYIPNLFVPDYGSKLTSAMFVRGVGSRINTPAVGLYVDDMAVKEKSAFDVNFDDVTSVTVLRGSQSTIYGRNAMGGMLILNTFNPLSARKYGAETKISLGGTTEDAGRSIFFRHSNTLGKDAALSLSAFYNGNDGYNRNVTLNRRSNGGDAGGAKLRLVYNPLKNPGLTLDFQSSLELSEENGYDYYKVADLSDGSYAPGNFGLICEDRMGSYRRTLVNNSLKAQYKFDKMTLSSVTSYQFLNDRMFMDQDFSPLNIFTLEQKQNSHYLAEELALRSNGKTRIDWVAGAFVSNQWLKTNAPVVFGREGIERMIQSGMDKGFEAANAAMGAYGMNIAANIDNQELMVDGMFRTPSLNAAVFGELTYKNLLPKMNLTVGMRVDYEHNKVEYNSGAMTDFTFLMTRGPIVTIQQPFEAESRYVGKIKNDYTHYLPKVGLTYTPTANTKIYASVSKGFRSGGYNIQMFSDLIQTSLKNSMLAAMQDDPRIGPAMERSGVVAGENPSADDAVTFKPEVSWNYELGSTLKFPDAHTEINVSLFYNRVEDQQIARFSPSGLGRQMVNAGKSENFGGEFSASSWMRLFGNILTLKAAYGYTHAKFIDYDEGDAVYDDNYVPFVPQHTASVAFDYAIALKKATINFGADLTGQGRIYWTEDNSAYQNFYLLLGAHVGFNYKKMSLNFFARNLTDKVYNPFYFVTMNQAFAQTSRPRQFGVKLTLTL